eukprot:scaffold19252_cov117-Isochrysis_galbana.AAC.5
MLLKHLQRTRRLPGARARHDVELNHLVRHTAAVRFRCPARLAEGGVGVDEALGVGAGLDERADLRLVRRVVGARRPQVVLDPLGTLGEPLLADAADCLNKSGVPAAVQGHAGGPQLQVEPPR